MVTYLDTFLFDKTIGDKRKTKALALAILIKNKKLNSVVKDYNPHKLAKLCDISPSTARKYVKVLIKEGLARIIGKHSLQILPIKNHKNRKYDLYLRKLDLSSLDTILLGLQTLFIYRIQSKKEFVKHSMVLKGGKAKKVIAQIEKMREKYDTSIFKDKGISYNYIAKKLGISKNTVSSIIAYGVKRKIFTVQRNRKFKHYLGKEGIALWRATNGGTFHYVQGAAIIQILANKFFIPQNV